MNHSHWAEINDDKYPIGKPDHGVLPWNEAPPVVGMSKTIADPHAATPMLSARRRRPYREIWRA